jgi:hypothetical protein
MQKFNRQYVDASGKQAGKQGDWGHSRMAAMGVVQRGLLTMQEARKEDEGRRQQVSLHDVKLDRGAVAAGGCCIVS